jgi:hypothetical protein
VDLIATLAAESGAAFSPDGRWIAYHSDESGRPEVYVRPFPGPGGRTQVSTGGGSYPAWTWNGSKLVYVGADRMLHAAVVETEPSFNVRSREALFVVPSSRSDRPIVPTPDGERFLVIRALDFDTGAGSAPARDVVVQNFLEELEALLPD